MGIVGRRRGPARLGPVKLGMGETKVGSFDGECPAGPAGFGDGFTFHLVPPRRTGVFSVASALLVGRELHVKALIFFKNILAIL